MARIWNERFEKGSAVRPISLSRAALAAGISLLALTGAARAQTADIGAQPSAFALAINQLLNNPTTGSHQTAYTYETTPTGPYPIASYDPLGIGFSIFTDCSGWVNYALNSISPLHQALTSAWRDQAEFNTGSLDEQSLPYARAFVLQSFFADSGLPVVGSSDTSQGFQEITNFGAATADNPNGLQAGDIVAYCGGSWCDAEPSSGDTGHTFIVVGTPTLVEIPADAAQQPEEGLTVWAVPIVDSTLITHYDDQRPTSVPTDLPDGYPADQFSAGGVGYGVIYIAVDANGNAVQTQFGPGDPYLPVGPTTEDNQKQFGAVRMTNTITISDNLVVTPFPNATPVINGTDYSAIAIDVLGTGSITVRGGGTLTMNGNSTYSGPTTVETGSTLIVNGSLTSDVTIESGASHGGSGSVGSLTLQAGSTLAPGNSIGTIHVGGDLTFASGAFFETEIDPTGTTDLIEVQGAANLNGGSLQIVRAPGFYQPGRSYTIVTAAGGVIGQFDEAIDDFVFLDAELAYSATSASFAFERNAVSFTGFAETANQRAVALALDGASSGWVWDVLVQTTDPAAPLAEAFDSLSGEVQASALGVILSEGRFVRDAAFDRLRGAFEPGLGDRSMGVAPLAAGDGAADPASAVWVQSFGSWGSTASQDGVDGLDRRTGGFFLGADTELAGDWRAGLLGGFSRTTFSLDDGVSSGSSDNYHLGLYAGNRWQAVGVKAGAAYSWNEIETARAVIFPNFAEGLTADYSGGTAQIFGEVDYRIEMGKASFEPFLNLAYVNLDTDGFSEGGGTSALTSAGGSMATTFNTLGLRASTDLDLGGMPATLRGMVGWQHAFGDVTPEVTMAFDGVQGFTTAGLPIAQDAFVVDAGFDLRLGAGSMLGIAYGGQFGDGSADQTASANWTIRF